MIICFLFFLSCVGVVCGGYKVQTVKKKKGEGTMERDVLCGPYCVAWEAYTMQQNKECFGEA